MDTRLLPFAEAQAPRYTSYPTAPHFSPVIGPSAVSGWLQALPADATLSLYLHIPFCRDICWYCGCHTFATRKDAPVNAYVETLIREIAMVAETTQARKVRRIAWGGGTPTILRPEAIAAIAAALRLHFDLSAVEEHGIEIDPRTITDDRIAALAEAGVSRVSLGVQDLNAHVQDAIGRIQPLWMVADSVRRIGDAGIQDFNLDLMYGLPEQSVKDAAYTAREASALMPDRMAVFGYAHVPWFKTRQKLIDVDALPDAATRMAQSDTMRDVLLERGYVGVGFDHYAQPDDRLAIAAKASRLKRNFQGYVDDDCDALIGLGASSISSFPHGYTQNVTGIAEWTRAIESGAFATARGIALSAEDKTRRAIIERVLCDFEVDLTAFGGAVRYADSIADLRTLQTAGLVEISGDHIRVAPQGRAFSRLVAQAFDAYREKGTARHSRAV